MYESAKRFIVYTVATVFALLLVGMVASIFIAVAHR